MITISYNLSSQLQNSLQKIEVLRRNILLTVITPKEELFFRWQATVERIYWLLTSSKTPLNKKEIASLLAKPPKKRLNLPQRQTLAYKRGFDYITQDWLGTKKDISLKAVLFLHQLTCSGRLRIEEKALKDCLAYFQSSNEHPVIQASLIYFQIFTMAPFTDDNDKLALLLSYLFLYKEGFDCRGGLVLDEYFRRNLIDYQQLLKQTVKINTQTLWIEYFAKMVENAFEKAWEEIKKIKTKMEISTAIARLNERQKKILINLENPEMTITNRQIQKLFKVSQITASRDLAKLVSLGLLFPYGKGRSIYYTRV